MVDQQQHAPGGHYSGANPVPTVKKFIEGLDKDKKERDNKIEEQSRLRKEQQRQGGGDAMAHHAQETGVSGTERVVTDPTTGNQVTISDVNKEMIDNSKNPQVISLWRVNCCRC